MTNKASHKQAFFFTIINYLGILIGVVSTLFIYPENKEMLGIFRYVESLAQTVYPIMVLGGAQALINFHPRLDENHKRQLFNYSLISILFISGVVLALILIGSYIPYLKGMKYVYFAFPIALFLAFIELLKKQSTIIQKIAVPTFFDNIIPKMALPAIFILVLYNYISVDQSLLLYIISYGLIAVFSALYLFYYFKPKFNSDFKTLFAEVPKKEYYKFSMFAFAGSLGSVFAFRIDGIMIPKLISMEANGTFSIGVTLASALAIPATGIFILYAPIVANYLKNNDFLELNMKYKEVSKLLFFIGALLYSCIFLGINDLFMLLPTHENLIASIPVILILGLNVVINMGTGFNSEIITYSKYYKFNSIAIVSLIVLNVTLNIFFIIVLKLGIIGVAIVSVISMVVFNFAKLWFIYKKFKLLPFDKSYLKLLITIVAVLFLIYCLPDSNSRLLNLIYKNGLCLLLNLIIIYKLKLVDQFNFWVNKLFRI